MANTIIELRRSNVSGNVPSNLANGEIAINTYDGKLFYRGGVSNTIQTIERFQGPAGLNQEIQFNDSGVLGSNSGLTFSKTTGVFTAPIVASSNNGNGTNFRVGDDAWIGDVNLADTIRISGQQNVNNAYIAFGASNANTLGRAGTGPLTYTGDFKATGLVSGNELTSTNSTGSEGGQVNLAIPASGTSLVGSVTIDVFQNKLRFFQGDSAKGAYIDLTAASAGVGSDLLAPSTSTDGFARTQANAAFAQANAAFTVANNAVTSTNGAIAWATANAAFTAANAATATNTTQNNSITAAFAAANAATATDTTQNNSITAAFTAANSAGVYANGAFARANNSLNANTGGTVTGDLTIGTGTGGVIAGANVIYSNVFVANSGGYVQFADGSRQFTANAGSGGGGTSNSFATISNTATALVANTSNTRLTIVGESGIVVAMNSSINQITIAAQPGAQGLTVDYGFVAEPVFYALDYGTL